MLSPVDAPANISELSSRGSLPVVVEEPSLIPTPMDEMPPPGTALVLQNRDNIVLDKVIEEEVEGEGLYTFSIMLSS